MRNEITYKEKEIISKLENEVDNLKDIDKKNELNCIIKDFKKECEKYIEV